MPGPDEIAAALTTAEAEVARLTAQLDAANAAEAAALVALTQATTALTAERDRRTRDLALTKERIRPLHFRGEAGLAARHTAQRVAQEAVRLGLGAVGFIGWLMAATSGDFEGWQLTALIAAEAGAVWFLGTLANREEQR